ncbi:glycosyltransferase [Chroococcus sp. FPU101]|uniref:glycosyltransferase n=1 Tax=Chroococcus sp. FPU101 TaxID=1974212 RepID=UPI001A8CA8DB|nr:glycosyltransferase [Chroococcus sp. FPU101]GFE68209.1 hypothetical protein CFPU101_08190 [Chroococcus sp. FPU101]
METLVKPKLVFFQFKNDQNLSQFVFLHRQQHIKCLSEFFEITVINEDCDYSQICERYQPDLTLFESGVNYRHCYRLTISNTNTQSEIPKLGLHNGDSWCEARAGFISDMEHWGIDTFFSICTTTAEYTPDISENVFVWPNFIDPALYRDYGQSKVIPVLLTGSTYSLYPWRQQINEVISQNYPSLICPHLGYGKNAELRMLYGEKYAKTINASWFVPTCGTIAKEVVRKHFEIPASKACLLTEKTPFLEAAGFVDLQNCVFANNTDVLEKLDYLFQNLDELEKIIDAGYQLVHSRHTLKHRDQILQWYNLHNQLQAHQKIVQANPFESLSIVGESSNAKIAHFTCNGLIVELLRQGDEKLLAGQYQEAEALYFQVHEHICWMPEPQLRLALCKLYQGHADGGLLWVLTPIKYTLNLYKALDPDPVEWAYFIIALLCKGKLDEAIRCADQFLSLRHPELDWTRWVVDFLKNGGSKNTRPNIDLVKRRYSVHQLPSQSFDEWIDHLCIMLKACKQLHFVKAIKLTLSEEKELKQKAILNYQKWRHDSTHNLKQATYSKPVEVLSLISALELEIQHISLDKRLKIKVKKVSKKIINYILSKVFKVSISIS